MTPATLESLLPRVRDIAAEAGRAILAVPIDGAEATAKADGSPVSRADTAAHRVIESGLARLAPPYPVISEEGDLEKSARTPLDVFWLVDPLDGTKEFLKGLPEYTVNIALVERGQPVLGVVLVPAAGVMYWAARGLGAWRASAGGTPERIAARPVETPVMAVVSRSHLSPETETFLAARGITQVIQRGSSLKMCAVAEGAADIYPRLGPTCLWDTAAGAAVAREAGCRVTDLQGRDLSYGLDAGLKHAGFIVCPRGMRA